MPEEVIDQSIEDQNDQVIDDSVEGGGEPADATFTVKVNGKERQLTLDEAKVILQKELSADEKFQATSDLRKKVTYYEQRDRDWAKAQEGDLDAIRRLPTYKELGVSQEQVDNLIAQHEDSEEEAPSRKAPNKRDKAVPKEVAYENLPPEVRVELERSKKERLDRVKEGIRTDLNKILAEDPILKSIIKKRGEGLSSRLKDFAFGVVQRRAQETKNYDPSYLREAAQESRKWLEDLGITSESGNPEVQSLGGAFTPSNTLHRSSKPPKRVPSSNTDEYAKYLAGKFSYHEALED